MIINKSFIQWSTLVSRFLIGQVLLTTANFIIGFLILRWLPISEYAVYIIAGVLLTFVSLGSDLGLSQALNTLGARQIADPKKLSCLFIGAYRYRRNLLLVASLIVIVVATIMLSGEKLPISSAILTVLLVLLTGWIQSPIALKKSILNVHHDAAGLFYVGMSEAIVRLGLVFFCLIWPTALTALFVNLAGSIVARLVLNRRCQSYIVGASLPNAADNESLKKFVIPLIPGIVYFLFQGQLSIFLLSYYGFTTEVAEVGALTRLGQIFGLLMILNPFLVQPIFARFNERKKFVVWTCNLLLVLVIFSLFCMGSVYLVPHWWLFLLGKNYSELGNELTISIFGALISISNATIYTIIISRNNTSGQSWAIVGGLAGQIAFVITHGVSSTSDALILNLVPLVSYFTTQLCILLYIIINWNDNIKNN